MNFKNLWNKLWVMDTWKFKFELRISKLILLRISFDLSDKTYDFTLLNLGFFNK